MNLGSMNRSADKDEAGRKFLHTGNGKNLLGESVNIQTEVSIKQIPLCFSMRGNSSFDKGLQNKFGKTHHDSYAM